MEIWHFIRLVTRMETVGCVGQREWGGYGNRDGVVMLTITMGTVGDGNKICPRVAL